ncbi:MAG TPA: hypothetical protein VMV49_17545 [Candidatus Deferrimicrobium sp.]|nr:hypothetical protein [Candidatus Deferrimicrobium sp.]
MSQAFNIQYDFLFKVILIGDEETMKGGLVSAFTNPYDNTMDYKQTIGVNFGISSIFLDDYTIKIQIWDILGGEKGKAVRPCYFRGASGCIMVIRNLEEAQTYLKEVRTYCARNIPIFFVYVGDNPFESQLHECLNMEHLQRVTNGSEGIEWLAGAMLSCRHIKNTPKAVFYPVAPIEIREAINTLHQMQLKSESMRLQKVREKRALQLALLEGTLDEMNLTIVDDCVEILTSYALFSINILTGKVQLFPLKCDECQKSQEGFCHKRRGNLCIIEASNGWSDDLDSYSLLILSKIYAIISNKLPKHVQNQIKTVLYCSRFSPIN